MHKIEDLKYAPPKNKENEIVSKKLNQGEPNIRKILHITDKKKTPDMHTILP